MAVCPTCGQATEKVELMVSLEANIAVRGGKMVRLAPREAEILWLLNNREPEYVSRDDMYEAFYGRWSKPRTVYNVLAAIVHSLRRKVKLMAVLVMCKRGYGYRLVLR